MATFDASKIKRSTPATPQKNKQPNDTSSAVTNINKGNDNSQSGGLFNANNIRRSATESPETFHYNGGEYAKTNDGSYVKVTAPKQREEKDIQSIARTGHETFGTDIGQALLGGVESWRTAQHSTAATLGLLGNAAKNGDNNYSPRAGSTLWRMLQASSLDTQEANKIMQDSKEGRGKVGSTVMEVSSQAVMNGIDAALKSIPIVGQVLGTMSFASRSFGSSAQKARDEGRGVTTQVVSGAVSAAIESVTESMWGYGGVRDYSGKYLPDSGVLGRLTSKTEAAIAEKLSPVVAKLVMSFGTEAVEEMAADLINPLVTGAVESWFGDTKLLQDFEREELQSITDILYDGLIGGLSGIGGGMVESVGLSNEIKNEYGGDKSAYVTAIRDQQERTRGLKGDARAIHRGSLADILDTVLNKRTGKTASELASEVAGTYVSQKNAYKMLGKQSEDYVKICRDTAKRFADTSFANEVMNKKFLENAAFRYLVNGDFASELNSVDDARQQIQTLAKYVMEEFANDKIANAKGKKGKAQAAFYNSVLAKLFDNGTATTTSSLDDVDNITEARTYQYGEEDLADNVDNAEEEEVARPVPQKPRTESKSQQEVNAMSPQERAKWILDSGSDTIRLEGSQNSKTYSSEAKALFDTIAEEAKNRGLKAEVVYNEQSKQWEARLTPVEQTAEAETDNAEQAEAPVEETPKLTKNDKQKINRLFSDKQKSVKIGSDAHGNLLLDTIRQRAEASGKEIVVENGKVRLAVKGENNVRQEEQSLRVNEEGSAEGETGPIEQTDASNKKSAGTLPGQSIRTSGSSAIWITNQSELESSLRTDGVLRFRNGVEYSLNNDKLNVHSHYISKETASEREKVLYSQAEAGIDSFARVYLVDGDLAKQKSDGTMAVSAGFTDILDDGTIYCVISSKYLEVKLHEPGHALFLKLLVDTGNLKLGYSTVDSALSISRQNDFIADLTRTDPALYDNHSNLNPRAKSEIFAYLVNADRFFTDEEVLAFYDALRNSGNKICVDFAEAKQPLLNEWRLLENSDAFSNKINKTETNEVVSDEAPNNNQSSVASGSNENSSLERRTGTSSESSPEVNDDVPSLLEYKLSDNKRENVYEQREEQNEAYAEAERQAMSDEELFERRYEDKYKTPTVQDTEREMREQPKATYKMSAKEANEIANLSFGEKGRVRATRAVERFSRIKSIFEADENGKLSGIGERVQKAMDTMRQHLVNVNDGYGTVQQIADEFRSWRDNKAMKDYWNEDVQARFDKILEDAESRGWEFNPQEQREFAQAYEEACNAMTARINNVNKDTDRMSKLKADAIANKRGWKSDGLLAKAAQKWIRMQATTDTALKFFGGFKGSGAFYDLSKDIKDSVAKRMVTYVDAYSYFDALKKMDGFKEFSENKKLYKLNASVDYLNDQNPLAGHEFTLQQIVTIKRLFETLNKTFEHSKPGLYDRIKGFVVRDAKGKSVTIELKGKGDSETHNAMVNTQGLVDAERACNDILKQEGAVFEVARAYDKACNEMFKKLGKQVSDVRKALTGNALSLIGENYTPVLWANEDGTPADFNFNDDDRIKPPSFLYNRTAKQGYLVVSDISYIVDKYIEKAADYVGTAQIKDTLARMNDGTSLLDNGKGLNSALAENFGKEAGSWFDEYVKDLTEYGENDSIWAALRRNMQKGALIGSPSVMMKQTSSYWSAMGLLSPEALTMAYRWKVGVKAADNSEFNPLLKYRSISDKFDPTLSEIIQDVSRFGKASNSRVFQLFVNGISAQDYKTVDNLYTATMIDTYLRNQNKDAKYFTSGEFQSDIDSKFTEVMMRSQPMFDTELRAEYARTDNELVKMTSMFRTQQTQNLNLIATAIGEYNASKGTGNQAEKAEVLRQTVAGQASAALSLALLSVAADFILHGLKKYRGDGDDEDEKPGDGKIELGRILGRIGLNAVEAGAGTAWFGDSVAKWLIDQMSGGETNEFYSFNMGPLSTMKSVIDNLEYAAKSPTPSNIKNVATNIAQLLGIPLNNAYRYVNSAVMYAHTLTGNNDKKYDDMLKMWGGAAKVADKNIKGRNLLVDSGMSKKEANAFVRLVDEDGNGLNKEELQEYYIEHPEDADKVSILWDSMGWKQTFAKAKKSLDKKVVYNSNPLYAEMDEDDSESVTKAELMNYYIDHPEIRDDLEKMYTDLGFKDFKSAVKSADKKIKFRSNPLYAEMDEDENESVSKSEFVNYYMEHGDEAFAVPKLGNIDINPANRPRILNADGTYSTVDSFSREEDGKEVLVPTVIKVNGKWQHVDEDTAWAHYQRTGEYLGKFDTPEEADAYARQLHAYHEMYYTNGGKIDYSAMYKELGFSGTLRSAVRSAESTKIKEAAEDAFYDGNYNALFESVSKMKNGKTWLTNMVKDEHPEYENIENPLLHYLTESGLSTKQIDTAVESFGGKKLIPQYKKLRESGLSPKQSVERLDLFDANDNGSITQTELADYYKAHPEEEAIIAEFWSACGWSKTWKQYKKSKKLK